MIKTYHAERQQKDRDPRYAGISADNQLEYLQEFVRYAHAYIEDPRWTTITNKDVTAYLDMVEKYKGVWARDRRAHTLNMFFNWLARRDRKLLTLADAAYRKRGGTSSKRSREVMKKLHGTN